jgi:hypothetical protein
MGSHFGLYVCTQINVLCICLSCTATLKTLHGQISIVECGNNSVFHYYSTYLHNFCVNLILPALITARATVQQFM